LMLMIANVIHVQPCKIHYKATTQNGCLVLKKVPC